MVARASAAHKLSAAELAMAARLQQIEHERAAADPTDEEAAEAARCFVTLVATPRASRAKGRALGGSAREAEAVGADELSVEAFQPTAACVSLVRQAKLRPASSAAELFEPARAELAFVSAARTPWPNRTAPVEFFFARVFDVAQAAGWLGSDFARAPAYVPDGAPVGANADADVRVVLPDEALLELREHMAERGAAPLDELLLDWRLLLCAGALLGDEQLAQLCDAALETDTAGLLRAHQLLTRRIGERIGHADEDD